MSSTRGNHTQSHRAISRHLLKSTQSHSALPDAHKTPSKQSLSHETSPADIEPHIGCYAYVMSSGYCMRANTLQSYMEMNRDVCCLVGYLCDLWSSLLQIARGASKFLPWEPKGKNNFVHESASIHPQTQVSCTIKQNKCIPKCVCLCNIINNSIIYY